MSSGVRTDARVEKIIRTLSGDLADEWIDAIEERGVDVGEEDKTLLTLAFWDAVRIALRDQIVRGDDEPIDDDETLERIRGAGPCAANQPRRFLTTLRQV